MPTTSPVARNPATVPAVMPSDTTVLSRAPAANTATQPTATAGLAGLSPASTPPATPITTRLPVISPSLRWDRIQVIHAAAHTPSMTAIAVPRGPPVAGLGRASDTVITTTTRPTTRTVSITRPAFTERAPGTGSFRVVRERDTPHS